MNTPRRKSPTYPVALAIALIAVSPAAAQLCVPANESADSTKITDVPAAQLGARQQLTAAPASSGGASSASATSPSSAPVEGVANQQKPASPTLGSDASEPAQQSLMRQLAVIDASEMNRILLPADVLLALSAPLKTTAKPRTEE